MSEAISSSESQQMSADDRKAVLARAVASDVRAGWHVQSQTDYQAVLRKGKRTSHGLHIFLSIITLGFWIPVWVVMAVLNRDKHRVVSVDPYGHLLLG